MNLDDFCFQIFWHILQLSLSDSVIVPHHAYLPPNLYLAELILGGKEGHIEKSNLLKLICLSVRRKFMERAIEKIWNSAQEII